MTVTRADIVAEARDWMNTPWQHQARVKGVGVDCAGLVTATARALGISTFDVTNYERLPTGTEMLKICDREMERIPPNTMQPGDAVCMRIKVRPQHIGILTNHPLGGLGMIHADSMIRKVVEHRLNDWWLGRIVRAYRFKGVE